MATPLDGIITALQNKTQLPAPVTDPYVLTSALTAKLATKADANSLLAVAQAAKTSVDTKLDATGVALSGISFPIYDGGSQRSLIDRSIEVINVADMPGGTTGAAADDDAALTVALSTAKGGAASQRKQVVFGGSLLSGVGIRSWKTTTQHEIAEGVRLAGISPDQQILPQNPVSGSSVFKITGGRSGISNLLCAQQKPYADYDFIQVCKPMDAVKPVMLRDLLGTGFRNFLRWQDGDCPQIIGCNGINNKIFLNYVNNGVSGYHQDCNCIGGGGVSYDMIAENLHPNSTQTIGVEGATFIGCDFLAGTATGPDGNPCNSPLYMRAGSFCTFILTGFSEVWQGIGADITGSAAKPISKLRFFGCYTLANLPNRQATGMVGMLINGAVTDVLYSGGDINGFRDFGMQLAGAQGQPALSPGFISVHKTRFHNNGRAGSIYCDLLAQDMGEALVINDNWFGSAPNQNIDGTGNNNSIGIAVARGKVRGSDNFFVLPPSFISTSDYNLDRSRGPGAVVGIPQFANAAAAVAAGLEASALFYQPDGTLRRAGIGS